MSFEQCTLEEATHVEVNGKVYEFGDGYLSRHKSLKSKVCDNIEVKKGTEGWQLIHVDAFQVLGIKPFKEIKPEPIVFEATFFKHDGKWRTLYLGDNHLPYENSKKARFKCVEILEEEK
jgi:hypothetical protein